MLEPFDFFLEVFLMISRVLDYIVLTIVKFMKLLFFLLQLLWQTQNFFVFFCYLFWVKLASLLQLKKLFGKRLDLCVTLAQFLVQSFNLSFLIEIQVSQAFYLFLEYFCIDFI